MPTLNPHTRELSFKLVFYGPGLGGKTTTLKTLFASTKPENRGKLVSVAVRVRFADTTVIAERFDWTLPIVGQKTTLNTGTARRRSVLPEGA